MVLWAMARDIAGLDTRFENIENKMDNIGRDLGNIIKNLQETNRILIAISTSLGVNDRTVDAGHNRTRDESGENSPDDNEENNDSQSGVTTSQPLSEHLYEEAPDHGDPFSESDSISSEESNVEVTSVDTVTKSGQDIQITRSLTSNTFQSQFQLVDLSRQDAIDVLTRVYSDITSPPNELENELQNIELKLNTKHYEQITEFTPTLYIEVARDEAGVLEEYEDILLDLIGAKISSLNN
jgi:hypothetical protein